MTETPVKIPVIRKLECQLTSNPKAGTTANCHTSRETIKPEAVLRLASIRDSSRVCRILNCVYKSKIGADVALIDA